VGFTVFNGPKRLNLKSCKANLKQDFCMQDFLVDIPTGSR